MTAFIQAAEAAGARAAEILIAINAVTESPERVRMNAKRLLTCFPFSLVITDAELVRRIDAALASERGRGRAGHWTYDRSRHIALEASSRALATLKRGRA